MDILIVVTDIVEKLILLMLFGLSIWSVAIILDRRKVLKEHNLSEEQIADLKSKIRQGSRSELSDWLKQKSDQNFVFSAIRAAVNSNPSSESVDRAVASYMKEQKMVLEKGLSVLATLGANAPFIGLFGTVLGIIRAFAYLGSQSGSAAVMSGVSQALYATAVGLFVAIPAVIGFNIFSKRIKDLTTQADSLRDLYISTLSSGK